MFWMVSMSDGKTISKSSVVPHGLLYAEALKGPMLVGFSVTCLTHVCYGGWLLGSLVVLTALRMIFQGINRNLKCL